MVTWQALKLEAWTALPYKMDEEVPIAIRKSASWELVLGNGRFRRELEQVFEKCGWPRKQGQCNGVGGIDAEQIERNFDQ